MTTARFQLIVLVTPKMTKSYELREDVVVRLGKGQLFRTTAVIANKLKLLFSSTAR